MQLKTHHVPGSMGTRVAYAADALLVAPATLGARAARAVHVAGVAYVARAVHVTRAAVLVHAALALAAFATSCTNDVVAPLATPLLPIASLSCPAHVDAGTPFSVDGSASKAPAQDPFVSTALTLVPGDQHFDDVSGTFTASAPGIATAKLVVTTKSGHTAEGRCRIAVDTAVVTGEGEGEPGEGEGEGAVAADLTGSFAMVAYDSTQVSGGSLDPDLQCGAAPSVSLVQLVQTGTHVAVAMTWCEVSLPNVQILGLGVQHTDIPQALVDALAPLTGSAEIDGDTFASSLDDLGLADIAGARLDDPDGALPSDTTDPQVTDDDGDGWPGVTIVAGGNAEDVVYRRYLRALNGTVVDNDTIDGSTPGSFQADGQAALLSSFFAFMVPTGGGLPSSFHMSRVDSAATCDDLRAQADDLIAAFPAPAAPDGCATF